MRASPVSDALKITMQYRARSRMVYELKSGLASIDIHVWQQIAEGIPSGWRVEAHESRAENATVIGEYGPTRREALRAVGAAWGKSQRALPAFDWEAVATLLNSVRAL